MVGVARNQRCRNCRRKKKGCDFQRPVCGPCARLGIRCGYDEKEWMFVSQTPKAAGTMSSFRVSLGNRNLDSCRRQSSPALSTSSEERSLNRTAFEIGSLDHFWSKYLPKDESGMTPVGGVYGAFWAPPLQDLSRVDETVGLALGACAMTVLARVTSDRSLLPQATRLHTRAILQINRTLSHLKDAQSDAVLASCKVLTLFESLRFGDGDEISERAYNWVKHIEGVCRIVELRGPTKHTSGHGHTLFEDCRIMAVIAGLTLRKPNFFNSVAWHTVPWETSPRNLRDELYDVMILLPELLEQQDSLLEGLGDSEPYIDRSELILNAQKLTQRCVEVGKSFRDWEDRTLTLCRTSCLPARSMMAESMTLLDVCKDHGYGFFNLVMQYWVGCMILCTSVQLISSKICSFTRSETGSTSPTAVDLPEIPDWMNPSPFASIIVSCAPHYFAPNAGLWGPQSGAFAIGAVRLYFRTIEKPTSTEMRRLRDLMRQADLGELASDFLESLEVVQDQAKASS